MGLLFGRRALTLGDAGVPDRRSSGTGHPAIPSEALRFSAVWAALRLRADLISTLPIDVFRLDATGAQVPAPATRLFTRPAEDMLWQEWLYSTQVDLDRYGNCFGQIQARDTGYPIQIEPWSAAEVTVTLKGRRIVGYRFDGRDHTPDQVWHERQYTVAGYRVGLSPLAYAAWAIGSGLSAQQFALDWFANGAHPSGTLRNTEQAELAPKVLSTAKERFRFATANRDLFVTGKEWEFTPAAVDANSAQFLAQMGQTAVDVARFIGVPASAIDAAVSGQSLTYANLTQKQLDLLVNYLTAPINRRERALSANALPAPRFAKFNSDALLRMDPTARTELMARQIDAWLMTPDEGRRLNNEPPLTDEQIAQLVAHKTSKPTTDQEALR